MGKIAEGLNLVELSPDELRQYIDAESVFCAYEVALTRAALVRGGMYWHKAPPTSSRTDAYLIRTGAAGAETSLGPRSPETEHIYAAFRRRKEAAKERLGGLKDALLRHRRMNRALRIGRVRSLVVDLLNRLASSEFSGHFRVVDTHSLYAYEAAAGVRFGYGPGARESELLWDVRERITLAIALNVVDSSLLGVLQKADHTFRMLDSRKNKFVNRAGFEVNILRSEEPVEENVLSRPGEIEDSLSPQAPLVAELLDCPPFSAMIVATNGVMARMPTADPMTFVRFKQFMSGLPGRDALMCRRDALQAAVVKAAVIGYLPQYWTSDRATQIASRAQPKWQSM